MTTLRSEELDPKSVQLADRLAEVMEDFLPFLGTDKATVFLQAAALNVSLVIAALVPKAQPGVRQALVEDVAAMIPGFIEVADYAAESALGDSTLP